MDDAQKAHKAQRIYFATFGGLVLIGTSIQLLAFDELHNPSAQFAIRAFGLALQMVASVFWVLGFIKLREFFKLRKAKRASGH